MFSKAALVILFAASAIATPRPIESSCNVGAVQCCESLHAPQSAAGAGGIGLITAVIQGFSGSVGLQCTPITGIGAGTGANCASAPVCCEHNNFNQLVGVNCSPITASL